MSTAVEQWRDLANRYRGELPAAILLGLVDRVSGGDPSKVSASGARGLYQIHPGTAAKLNVPAEELLDPATSTHTAVRLLTQRAAELAAASPALEARPEDLLEMTLAAYWYGPAAILSALRAGATSSAQVWASAAGGEKMRTFAADVLERSGRYIPIESSPREFPWAKLAGLGLLAAGILWWANRS